MGQADVAADGPCQEGFIDPRDLPDYALRVLNTLENAGYEAWVVGGWVRDALRGDPAHDVDVTTSAPWPETERVLCAAGVEVHETGVAHGTVTAVVEGHPVETTTYRVEGAYSDLRHPDEVRFVEDVRQDLARRDFTINAMAWHPVRGLLDPYGGREDLAHGLVRAVGEPRRRFGEDALRILRAVRFAARFGFSVEDSTQEALVACAGELAAVARERVGQELQGILDSGHMGWALANEPQVMRAALPILGQEGLDEAAGVCGLAEALAGGVPAPALRWAALLCGLPWGEARRELRRMAVPGDVVRRVGALLGTEHVVPTTSADARHLMAAMERACSGEGSALALQWLELSRARAIWRDDAEACAVAGRAAHLVRTAADEHVPLCVRDLEASGSDAIAAGVPAGPAVGRCLEWLLERVLAGELPNERDALLAAAASVHGGLAAPRS